MKKNATISFILGLLIVIALVFLAVQAHGQSIPPKPTNFVNDYAHALSPGFVNKENKLLSDYQKSTTNEIAVVMIPTTGDQSIEEYSIALADAWKPGVKGKDNGAIIVFALQDHHDRIEVGRGLEGNLTDIQSEDILNDLKPDLRAGNNDKAVETAVQEVIAALNGSLTPHPSSNAPQGSTSDGGGLVVLVIIVIIILVIIGVFLANQDGSSYSGGDSSDDSSDSGDDGFFTGALAGGAIGYGLGKSSNNDSSDDSSSSSSFGGFGSSSSDDSGSSFGGFSGGSFSGGGASGSW